MHGPLSEIGLIEVLQLLQRGGRSGVLRLVGPDQAAPRSLTVIAGRVVALEPDASDEAVRRALVVRAELLDGDSDSDAVGPKHLEAVRHRLARMALGRMLHWNRGRFDFEAGHVEPGPLDWSADALVLELVEAESRRAELAGLLADWHATPELLPAELVAGGEPVTLEALDWRILDAIDGRRDVASLAAHLQEPLEDVGARIRALEAAAILRLRGAAPESAGLPLSAATTESYVDRVARLRVRLEVAPNDGETWRSLGLAEVGAGRFDRAVAAWQAWQQAVPEQSADAGGLIRAAQTMMEALRDTRE